jgi:multidrug efflux system outer membrane protein
MQATYGVTRSQLYPQVGMGVDASRQRGSVAARRCDESDLQHLRHALLGASWEIDLWGKIRRQSEAARAQIVASEEGGQGVILTLVSSVAGGYIYLRDLDRQLEIARSTARARGDSFRIFKDRYEGGVISILELSQNKSQYEEALATIPQFEKTIAQQENALSVLLGRNPGPIPRGKDIDRADARRLRRRGCLPACSNGDRTSGKRSRS